MVSQPTVPTQLPRDCEVLLYKNLSDTQKLKITLNFSTFTPNSDYAFPSTVEYGKKTLFPTPLFTYIQVAWLFCLSRWLPFPSSDADKAETFVHKSFSSGTTLNKKLRQYHTSATHTRCVAAMNCFVDAHSGTQPTIDTSLNKCRQERYELNFKRLDAIIDCVVLCGRQNIAFRGHRMQALLLTIQIKEISRRSLSTELSEIQYSKSISQRLVEMHSILVLKHRMKLF